MEAPVFAAGVDSRQEIEDIIAHIVPRKPFPQYVDDTVFLEIKEQLLQHPDKHVRAWSENPRLYTLLRMLEFDDQSQVFKKFDTEHIGDFWIPLTTSSLNQLASTTGLDASAFFHAQMSVLSRPEQMSEEKLLSGAHAHRHINSGTSHFEEIEKIGKGGSAEVVRVKHKLSGKQFACKRILRMDTIKAQRNQLIEFEQEVGVLQRIHHHHFVSFVASFTDRYSFSLILNPVAKDVLKSMLDRQTREQPLDGTDVATLRRSFFCIATALAFLHEQRVRHKDIKPGNILLSDGRVYLCDFGISRDWSKSEHSTTEGDVLKFTRRYCAPEVSERDPRNTKSDIWSLGCVFLEMISVVKGYTIDEVNQFLLDSSYGASSQGLWCAPEAMYAWLVKIRSEKNDSADDLPLDWIVPMIRTESEERLTASEIVEMINKQAADLPRPDLFISSCCSRSESVTPVDNVTERSSFSIPKGLGISDSSMSPSSGHLHPPRQTYSPTAIDGPRIAPGGQGGPRDRDGSVSPGTRSFGGHRDSNSTDTVPFPMDPFSPPINSDKSIRHITSRNDSHRGSNLSFALRPESILSSGLQRPTVPQLPASFKVKCACGSREREKHIFNATFSSSTFDTSVPTIETCPKCELGENRVQIYETFPEDPNVGNAAMPMFWWVTRRLVVSYLSGNPEMRRCSSFWIPLADIQFNVLGSEVTIHWSDCNQMTQRRSGNYGQHYDWLYTPKQPNNRLTIHFDETSNAQQFIDCLRLPYEDGIIVSHGRQIDVSNSQEVNIFDVGRRGVRNYRVASLTTVENGLCNSKLYIHWPEVDLDIRIHDMEVNKYATAPDYQMIVHIHNVSTPTYHSDIRGEPAVDYAKIGRFNKAIQLKSSFTVSFPIGMKHSLPAPPIGVVEMLYGLSGWRLRYFAIVVKFRSKNKRFGSKKYGRADVMLWEREIEENSLRRRGAQVTFRLHEEMEFLWTSGAITSNTAISYAATGLDATINVSNKARGRLLDVSKMAAIAAENAQPQSPRTHSRHQSDANEDLSDLVLTFEDARYRLEFVKLVEEFKAAAAAAAPLARMATVPDSFRRIGSLASNDIHMSPPMR